MSQKNLPLPEVSKSEVVYRGFYNLRIDQIAFPNQAELSYTVLITETDAAVVLAETAEGKFVLIKEYRHPTKGWVLGCPGGRIDPGETPMEAAKRELLEETGYSAETFISMGAIFPFPALGTQKIDLILAKNATLTQFPRHEPHELIEVVPMVYSEIVQAIGSGASIDGVLSSALFFRSLMT